MWPLLWNVGKWIVAVSAKVFLWAAANPLTAVLVGAGVATAGVWLSRQPWAGADVLAGMLGFVGESIVSFGIGAWIGGQIFGVLGRAARAVGRVIGAATWDRQMSFALHGGFGLMQ